MSKIEKFIDKIMNDPIPLDITFDRMSRFLISIGCKMKKKTGTSHRQFKYPGFYEIITLMEDENVKDYQIKKIRELLKFCGIVKED